MLNILAITFTVHTVIFGVVLFLIHPENVFGSEEARKVLEETLSSPKISNDLKQKFCRSLDTERPHIIIEFDGGNAKGITEFKEAPISSRLSATKGERISVLVDKLQHHAVHTQGDLLRFLHSSNFEHVSLWAANEVYVKNANARVVADIVAKFHHVSKVRPAGLVPQPRPVEDADVEHEIKPPSVPVNVFPTSDDVPQPIRQIHGRCKDIKCLGEGAVVAILDTGVKLTHDELFDNWRQDFGWYDPLNYTQFPVAKHFHGTHVTGITVGKTKGVAPRAQWIACLALGDSQNDEILIKQCGEWVLCPFRWNDPNDRDCSKAPDVINNSWGIPQTSRSRVPNDFFYGTVAAWNAAGIISFFAAGNYGPFCTSVIPPAMYDTTFSIAATDNTSTIIGFSSRGPVLNKWVKSGESAGMTGTCKKHCTAVDNPGHWGAIGGEFTASLCTLTKPEISAPGVLINSSTISSNSSYGLLSGTSMATPIVSGVALLMVCANSQIPGNTHRLDLNAAYSILKSTANTKVLNLEDGNEVTTPNNLARTSHLLCNVITSGICGFPNNVYGWGEVDACSAVRKVKARQ